MSAEWQFIVSLNEQLRPLRNPAEVQAVAIRLIGQHLAASRVSYSYVDGDEFVISRSYTDGVEPITGRGRLTQIGVGIVEAYRRGETVVVNDVHAEPRLTEFERAHWVERQTAALVGVPLIKDGRWLATFNVHSTTPRGWTPDQIALIELTAQRAWAMGEHARAEETLSRGESRQAFLRRLSDAVRPLSDPAIILEEACRLLGTHLRANRAIYGEIDGDECVVRGGYADGVPPLPRRFPWRQLAGSQVADILEGRTLTSNDTCTNGHTADEILYCRPPASGRTSVRPSSRTAALSLRSAFTAFCRVPGRAKRSNLSRTWPIGSGRRSNIAGRRRNCARTKSGWRSCFG